MKEIAIKYHDSDYTIRYECKKQFIRHRSIINTIDYTVFFGDESLKKQFGDPFEIFTGTYPKFSIIPQGNPSAAAIHMATAIINAMPKADRL